MTPAGPSSSPAACSTRTASRSRAPRLYLSYYQRSDRDQPQPVRATSGSDGRFRFTVQRSNFDRPHDEPWRIARLVALADGYAPGGLRTDVGPGRCRRRVDRPPGSRRRAGHRPARQPRRPARRGRRRYGSSRSPRRPAATSIPGSRPSPRQPDLYTMEYHYIRRLRAPDSIACRTFRPSRRYPTAGSPSVGSAGSGWPNCGSKGRRSGR